MTRPLISILIPTYKATDYLLCCVRSLVRSASKHSVELCLYGDGGGDASRVAIEESKALCDAAGMMCETFYNPKNLGNTAAVNAARKLAHGEWLLLINDDMVFPINWYADVSTLLNPNTVVSFSCIEPNVGGHKPSAYFAGINLGLEPSQFSFTALDAQNETLREASIAEGVNYPFLVEANLFDKIGGVDERFFGPYHDPDLFLRFRLQQVKMMRTKLCWAYHFSGISQRFLHQGNEQKHKRKMKSAFWRNHENTARIQFIKKWGAKPKAHFGEIPQTDVTEPWENRRHRTAETIRYVLLLYWEVVRIWWQKIAF